MKNTWLYGFFTLVLIGSFLFISSSRPPRQDVGAADKKDYIFLITGSKETTIPGGLFGDSKKYVDVSFEIRKFSDDTKVVLENQRFLFSEPIKPSDFSGTSFFFETYPHQRFNAYKDRIEWKISPGVSSTYFTGFDVVVVSNPGQNPSVNGSFSSTPPFLIPQCSVSITYKGKTSDEKLQFNYSFCFSSLTCRERSMSIDSTPLGTLQKRVEEAVKEEGFKDIVSWYNQSFTPSIKNISDVSECGGKDPVFIGLQEAVASATGVPEVERYDRQKSSPVGNANDNCKLEVSGLSIQRVAGGFQVSCKQLCIKDVACFSGKSFKIEAQKLTKDALDEVIKEKHRVSSKCDMRYVLASDLGADNIEELIKVVNAQATPSTGSTFTEDEVDHILKELEERKRAEEANDIQPQKLTVNITPGLSSCRDLLPQDPRVILSEKVATLILRLDQVNGFLSSLEYNKEQGSGAVVENILQHLQIFVVGSRDIKDFYTTGELKVYSLIGYEKEEVADVNPLVTKPVVVFKPRYSELITYEKGKGAESIIAFAQQGGVVIGNSIRNGVIFPNLGDKNGKGNKIVKGSCNMVNFYNSCLKEYARRYDDQQKKPAIVNPVGQQQQQKNQYILFTDPPNCGPCRELEIYFGFKRCSVDSSFCSYNVVLKFFDSGRISMRSGGGGEFGVSGIPTLVSSKRGEIENKVGPSAILDFLATLKD